MARRVLSTAAESVGSLVADTGVHQNFGELVDGKILWHSKAIWGLGAIGAAGFSALFYLGHGQDSKFDGKFEALLKDMAADSLAVINRIDGSISQLRAELRAELQSERAELRAELRSDRAERHSDMRSINAMFVQLSRALGNAPMDELKVRISLSDDTTPHIGRLSSATGQAGCTTRLCEPCASE